MNEIPQERFDGSMKQCVLLLAWSLYFCPLIHAADDAFSKASCYIKAYPDFFIGYEDGCLIAKDGHKIPFDDGIPSKDYSRMVVDPGIGDEAFDPEDALYWDYRDEREIPTPDRPPVGDPGRMRPPEIFEYMYGSSKSDRTKRLRKVQWVNTMNGKTSTILMTTVNGVDRALEEVVREIRNLPEKKKRTLERIVFDVRSSGYYERSVRDFPQRTSAHAYGIAVDVNWDDSYFIGRHRKESYRYRNNIPQFLVDIFERHGFIWGGRWHSYDAMHFEYRPELLQYKNLHTSEKRNTWVMQ
jgi:hypothetical protein